MRVLLLLVVTLCCLPCTLSQIGACDNLQNLSVEDEWKYFRLSDFDRYFILIAGGLSVLLMALTLLSFLIYRSFLPPADILFLIALAEFIQNSSMLASAIYQTLYPSDTLPINFQTNCFVIGFFNVFGNVASVYYNAIFCVFLAYSIRNTLKRSMLSPKRYHFFFFLTIISTMPILIFTNNIGDGLGGVCGYKVASSESVGKFVLELLIACACILSMVRFRSKIPKNSYFKQQSLFGFYFYYMGFFSLILLLSTVTYMVGSILCRTDAPINNQVIKILFTIGNCIDILLAYVIFVMRVTHPILHLKVRRFFGTKKDNNEESQQQNEEEMSWIGCLIQSIKGSQILSFISAIMIGFIENQSKVPKAITPYHYSKNYSFILSESVSDEYVTRRISNRESLLAKQKSDGLRTLDYEVVVYNPEVYSSLLYAQKIHSIFQSFDIRKNISIVKKQSYTNGGKSGEFFFGTHDNMFIFKTIRADQAEIYIEKTQFFKEYFEQNEDSLIVKILGLYKFIRRDVEEEPIYIMLMQNLTRVSKTLNERVFDIKGSEFNRSTMEENNIKSSDFDKLGEFTLKDKDFLHTEGKIYILPHQAQRLKQILRRDIQFLGSMGVMDYSFLVIKRKGQDAHTRGLSEIPSTEDPGIIYNFGLIDYLESWTFRRKAERAFKTMITNEEVTANSPLDYSKRLIEFIDQIF